MLDEVEAVRIGRDRVVGEVALQLNRATDEQVRSVDDEERARRPRKGIGDVAEDDRLAVG